MLSDFDYTIQHGLGTAIGYVDALGLQKVEWSQALELST